MGRDTMIHIKNCIAFISVIFMLSCASQKTARRFRFANSGILEIKLESYNSCYSSNDFPYILYTPVEQQNIDVVKFDKRTGEITPINDSLYDEYEAVGINEKSYCYISKEYGVKGNVVYKKDGKITNIGEKGEEEFELSLAPDKSLIGYLSKRQNTTYLNIYNFKEKERIYRKKIKAETFTFLDQRNILFVEKNKIYRLDFVSNEISLFYESQSLKYKLNYLHQKDELYYIAIPFDTNQNEKLDENDAKFITVLKNGKEIFLKEVHNFKRFGVDDTNLYYIEDKKLKYQLINFSIPQFSSANHYFEYLKKIDNQSKKIIVYNYLFKNLDKFESYDTNIVLNYLKFMRDNRYIINLNYIIKTILLNYPEESKNYYAAELFKNNIYQNNNFPDIYNEFKADLLFEGAKYRELEIFLDKIDEYNLSREMKNKFQYYRVKSNFELKNYSKTKELIIDMTEKNLSANIWIEKAIEVFFSIPGEKDNYSYNRLKEIQNKYKDNDFIYTFSSIELSNLLKSDGKYNSAIEELEKSFNNLSAKRDFQNKIAVELSKVYISSEHYIKGVSFVKNYLENNEYSGRRKYFLNYIKNNGLYLAEKYYAEKDLLRAQKWLKVILNFLPNSIEANRELIKISFEMSDIEETAGRYKSRYINNKEDPFSNYYFGYAITYLGTKYGYGNKLNLEQAAYRETLEYLNRAIKLKADESLFYLTKGWVLEQLHRFGEDDYLNKALSSYKKGLALSHKKHIQNYFYRNIGNIYYKMELYERSFNYIQKLDGDKIQWQNIREKISYLLKLSDIYYQLNYYEKAIEVDNDILNYYKNNHNYEGVVNTINHIGLMHNQLENYLQAAGIFEKNLKIIENFEVDYDKMKVYRNIAFNSLKAGDDIGAIEASKQGLEFVKDRVGKKKKKSFLDISLIFGLKGDSTEAYRGFTPEMERNIFYSILATAYGRLGNWKESIYYYQEKLKISSNDYADFIITNNLYNIYYELNEIEEMNQFLEKSYKITKKHDLKRGYILNVLTKIFLKNNVNEDDVKQLFSLEENVKQVDDEEINFLYRILFNHLAEKFLDKNYVYDSITDSVNHVETEMKIIQSINSNLNFLEKNLEDKIAVSYLKRSKYLYEYKYFGSNNESELKQLLGNDSFIDLIINYDLVNININKGNYQKAYNQFEELINIIRRIDESDYNKLSLFYRYNKDNLYSNISMFVQQGYKTGIISFLTTLENIERYTEFERFNPEIASQVDKINLNNYFYELEFQNFKRAEEYLNEISVNTKFFIGKMEIDDKNIYEILDKEDKIAYKILDQYLLIDENGLSIDESFENANYRIDRDGKIFDDEKNNFFSLSQFYIAFNNRFPSGEYKYGTLNGITSLDKSFLTLKNVEISSGDQINPFDSEFGNIKLKDMISKDITTIGLNIEAGDNIQNIVIYKNLLDILFYLDVSEVYLGGYRFGYKDFSNEDIEIFAGKNKDHYNSRSYLYFKNGKYRKAFFEMKKLIYLIEKSDRDNSELLDKLMLIINIGANYLNDPELIEPYLRQYIRLKNLKEIDFYTRMAALYEKNGFYSRAIEIHKKMKEKYDINNDFRQSILYQKMGDMQKALEYLNKVDSDKANLEKAKILYKYLNNYDMALDELESIEDDSYREEIKLLKSFILLKKGRRQESFDSLKELKESSDGDRINSLFVNISVGEAQMYFENNDYLDSIRTIKNTLEKLPAEKYSEEKTILGNLLGLNHMRLNQFEASLSILSDYINFAEENNIRAQIPYLKLNYNLLLIKTGRYNEALNHLHEMERNYANKNNILVLNTIYKNFGLLYYSLKNYKTSRNYFEKVIKNRELIEDKNTIISFKYLYKISDNQRYLNNSMEIAEKHNNREELLDIYYLKGKEGEFYYLKQAFNILKTLINKAALKSSRVNLLDSYKIISEKILNYYLDNNKKNEYIKQIEELKYLKRAVYKKGYYSFNNVGPEKIDGLENIQKELQIKIDNNNLKKDDKLKARYQKELINLYLANNINDIKIDLNINYFNQNEIDENTIYINYIILNDYIYSGYVDSRKIKLKKIPYTKLNIKDKIVNLRKNITEKKELDEIKKNSEILFKEIIPGDDRTKSNLIISADGILKSIPFDALYNGEDFLINYKRISLVPGFYYIAGVKNKKNKMNKIFAVGNPDLKREDLELYFAQKESREIDFLFDDVNILIGESATETEVKNILNNNRFDITHFATHSESTGKKYGEVGENYLMMSSSEKDDGMLMENEIKRLNLNSELVVLSACETGTTISEEDSFNSIDSAFQNSSIRMIISSLWRISDVHTGFLFKNFYRNLYFGKDIKTSLYDAKIEVKNRFEHPVYWAGIKYIGL
ncbi:MAG: CHAT domain-containing protein [Candidatus Mcinerneyibacterium aminivorans]|uniref:CHAT domain-containing protein n=1 Tax=Candidatus Mcinerneyibacterium aminivorans TaxID=2703815 RepID=A0A5D0MIU6_9BACT|nr:MAG: CHAT domain-containing protein [Candidatus Mcinerneyibacterium aminivorans]